ncbi:MAG TPA: protein kinase [Pirellulaceae bacterium]|nr:protein kinase [Pirellulaceae bacterium]
MSHEPTSHSSHAVPPKPARANLDPHLAETCDQVADDKAAELVKILDQHLAELKAGSAPSRTELIARHPQLASQLEACLAGLEFIHGAEAAPHRSQRLGDFRIIREVGRGGMGAVFEAEQISLGRRVALKILRFGGVSDPEALERFQREAATVAKLHHTNIVPIFNVGTEHGVNYYAMQFIDGKSLAEVLAEKKQPLPPEQVAEWGLQAADALTHAHQRGVIHRDVKPSNLLLDKENRLWLTDFGLARRLDDVTLSLTGALLGTPRYMSPEQAVASKKRVDHRTDLFSLGATLYELVTGKPAFGGDTPHDVIQQILSGEPTPIRQLQPSVPRDLETIVMKCLAKEPAQRYGAARDLADDLRAFLDGRPIRARRASFIELATRWLKAQQRSVQLAATAAALTLLVTIGSVAAWFGYDSWQQGSLKLSTPTPPLVAEIIDQRGGIVRRDTLPMQESASLPAGNYQIRAQSEGSLSQTFEVSVARASEFSYSLDLRDTRLFSMDIARSFAFADLGKPRKSIVLLGNDGIAPFGWSPAQAGPQAAALKEFPGFRWPWSDGSEPHSGYGVYDLRPWVAPRGHDLNGDGERDLICAGRHQAWLMAISGMDGKVLWFAARGHDLKTPPQPNQPYYLRGGVLSSVFGEPIVDQDCNGDGVPDCIATLADVGSQMVQLTGDQVAANCWIEAVSGKTGETIWKYELPAKWFELPGGAQVPYQCRWFVGSGSGSSMRGSGMARSGRQVYRQASLVERSGMHAYRPESARPITLGNKTTLAVVAATHLALLDPRTGQEAQPPLEMGTRPSRPPQWGDMDGDGNTDLVILSERPASNADNIPLAKLTVWSPARARLLWTRDLDADWPITQSWTIEPPKWPLVADLDGDGKCEIAAPDGSSSTGNGYFGSNMGTPWGRVVVSDGSTGNELWNRRLVSMDQQIDHLTAGPDIDADGWREVYAATLSGGDYRIFVDCLSGRTGRTLWSASGEPTLADAPQLVEPRWWNAGEDGWPQLLVQAVDDTHGRRQELVCTFSAGTGKLSHVGRGISTVEPADIDGDGIDDLVVFDAPSGRRDFGGKAHVVRGVAAEPWRRLGNLSQPAADLDGDGVIDLLQTWADGTLIASSGRSGRVLWQSRLSQFPVEAGWQAAGADLDGDKTEDLLTWSPTAGHRRKELPLFAMSGRTGKVLWNSPQIDARFLSIVLAATTADLDADGKPEAVWMVASDHGYPESDNWSSHDFQLWLFVTSGQSGALVWSQPLSPAFGGARGNSPNVQLHDARIQPTVADLDRDGTMDLIVPAITASGADIETRALSGKDGRQLWSRHFPRNPNTSPPSMQRWVAPTVADLSPDGSRQAVLVELGPPDPGTIQATAVLRVIGVDAASGKVKWNWGSEAYAGSWSTSSSSQPGEGELLRPVVLRASGGGRKVATYLPGSRSEMVVFDGTGKAQQRKLGQQSDRASLWACDVDGDGVDEVAFLDKSVLIVARPDQLNSPIWTYDTRSAGLIRILGVLPGSDTAAQSKGSRSPIVALLDDPTDNTVRGFDSATGKLVWSCPGPIPRAEDDTYLMMNQLALLGAPVKEPPFIYHGYSFLSRCRQAAWIGDAPGEKSGTRAPDKGAISLHGASAAAPVLEPLSDDMRWKRPLPWNSEYFVWSKAIAFLAWAMFFSVLLVVIPAAYVIRLVWLRRFGLRTLLVLPVVAALFLTGALTSGPPDNDFSTLLRKLSVGVGFAPVVLAFVFLPWWAVKGQFRRIALWLCVSLVIGAIWAALALRHESLWRPLGPEEGYDWSGWYMTWFPGAFATAWIALIVIPLKLLAITAWKKWSGRRLAARNTQASAPTIAIAPTQHAAGDGSPRAP